MENLASEEEDLTCCHRATWCLPRVRSTLVTQPIFGYLLPQFTYGTLFWLVTVLMLLFFVYAILFFYLGEHVLPGSDIFGLFTVVVLAYFLGWGLAYVPHLRLPPVFGMLLAGIILRNADVYNIHESLGMEVCSNIRTFATTFVMLRAGLEISSSGLYEHPFFIFELAFLPCTMEFLTMTVCCKFILGYPLLWALLTGSVIACISPVVTINCMLALAEKGYGEDKEIATLLFTASSIDDIHIISLYTIFFSFIFSNGNRPLHWWSFLPVGFRDLLVGVVIGTGLGLFFTFFPHRSQDHVVSFRLFSLILGSLMCTTAPLRIEIVGAGFLATIMMSVVATTGWRKLSSSYDVQPFRDAVSLIWHFMQPVLIGVIGASCDFRDWQLSRFGLYVVCISLSLSVRVLFTYIATRHAPFNTKERIFVAFSWIGKGTLQAALAPMVYEQAVADADEVKIGLAEDVVRVAIVSIVFLAPIGALVMMITGPYLLNKVEPTEGRPRLSHITKRSLQPVRK